MFPKMASDNKKLRSIHEEYWKTKKIIGEGSHGKMYKWKHKSNGTEYAVKVLENDKWNINEVKLHYRLSFSQNIVNVVDLFKGIEGKKQCIYIVMEYMEGGDLLKYTEALKRNRTFTERKAAFIMYDICQAIHFLHSRNIAHRDLKPQNILLTHSGPDAVLKLGDLGFAKKLDHYFQTPAYTSYFAPPEILRKLKYGISCDLWSLGILLYTLLYDRYPFIKIHKDEVDVTPTMRLRITEGKFYFPPSNVSESAKDLITALLQTKPNKRLSIEQVLDSEWIQDRNNVKDHLIVGIYQRNAQKIIKNKPMTKK